MAALARKKTFTDVQTSFTFVAMPLSQSQTEQLSSLMTKVVSTFIPDESTVFQLKRDRLLSYGVEAPINPRDAGFEMGPAEKAALECIPLVLGSLRALLELLKAAREMKAARETRKEGKKSSTKPEKDFDIKERWASELASAGLTSERARAIADKFYEEFSAIVKS